ncbi:MAG: NAD(P)-dependent oxidoreductase [Rhodobacteraceae bacterium]|nr:NAD(P)-dependent oxidoreductase [Paracoccaceae bacterium]
MTILLFGASSQVGQLLSDRPDVVTLSRADADLRDPARCARIIETARVDAVINAAAFTDIDGAETARATASVVNARAPAAMARAAALVGIPLVHLSCAEVFSGKGRLPWRPEHTPAPIQVYGASRLSGEEAVRAAGGTHAIVRTSWVHSAHGHNVLRSVLRAGRARRHLTLSNAEQGSPTPAAALADAACHIAQALIKTPSKSGTYHYAGREGVSRAEFARAIFEAAEMDVAVANAAASSWHHGAPRPKNGQLDASLTKEVFGLEPPDWSTTLPSLVRLTQATRRAA